MGVTFNKENAIDLLNYETKFGYWQDRKIPASQRKVIIQKLADVLFDKIKNLSLSELKEFLAVISTDLNKKNMLFHFANPEVQKFIVDNNWGGTMLGKEDSDYFSVIDTNTLSGKAEPYIDKDYNYSVNLVNNELIATLKITYHHNYDEYLANDIYQDDPGYLQQYKSYTRVYVPKDSWLISIQKDNNEPTKDGVSFAYENNKTVFGFYLTINKNTTSTYTLIYKLPAELSSKLLQKYSLIYQKQSGGYKNHVTVSVNFNKTIKGFNIDKRKDDVEVKTTASGKNFTMSCDNNTDKFVDINFYQSVTIDYIKDFLKISQ
jgi:hypothetical protein